MHIAAVSRAGFARIAAVCLIAAAGIAGCHRDSAPDARLAGGASPAAIAAEPLTYIAGSLTDEEIAALERELPNLRIIRAESREDALQLAAEADGSDARYVTAEFMERATKLRWVQSPSAGVERYLAIDELRTRDGLVMTNMRGVHGPTIAEHAFGMLLSMTRDIRYYTHPDRKGTWERGGSGADLIALNGRTLLVVGLGGIGREVAKIGDGLGMRVLATRRSVAEPPPYVDELGTGADLDRFIAEADVVVLAVPLTDETRGMFGADRLAAMKQGSYLVNVARGPVVDTQALIAALEDGPLAGACLDVTDPEPLPADHPLWDLPNVVITPHVSSRSGLTSAVWKQTYLENVRRFARGEELLNVVDRSAGY